MPWQLQDAQNDFQRLLDAAQTEGPQVVNVHGERAAVVLSAKAYDELVAKRPSLVDHLLSGETWDDELVETINARSKAPGRDPGL